MSLKKVLMIAYNYPPIGGVGMIRTLKFSKYLPEYGWEPHVLTVKNRDRFYTSVGKDTIPSHVHVYRSLNVFNNLSLLRGATRQAGVRSEFITPDVYLGWVFLSVRKAKKIIQDHGIDLIYVSCPPHSSAFIAEKLKRDTGIPFILDLRDAWTLNPYLAPYLLKLIEKKDERLEKKIMRSADCIITATKGIRDDYIEKYSFIKKIYTITNGFDLDDVSSSKNKFDKFTVVYTGYFFRSQSPELFFIALKDLLDKKLIPADNIQFLWAGRPAPFVHQLADAYQVNHIINYIGFLSKKEADALLYKSHLLFLIIGAVGPSAKTIHCGKLFPYLASGTPILGILPEGEAKELIQKYSPDSYVITGREVNKIKEAILNAYTKWRNGKNEQESNAQTNQFRTEFNYNALTGSLSDIFNSVIENKDI